jgi:hypothetical protein
MLKMLLDPMGGIVLTNDGNAILREVLISSFYFLLLDWRSPSSSKIDDRISKSIRRGSRWWYHFCHHSCWRNFTSCWKFPWERNSSYCHCWSLLQSIRRNMQDNWGTRRTNRHRERLRSIEDSEELYRNKILK